MLTPQEFIQKLDLSKLDDNTAQEIREFINSEEFKYIELSQELDEFKKVVEMIETHFPEAIGLPSKEELANQEQQSVLSKKAEKESSMNQILDDYATDVMKQTSDRLLNEEAEREEQESRDAEELSKRLKLIGKVDSKVESEKKENEKQGKKKASDDLINGLKEKVDNLTERLELVKEMSTDDPKNKKLKDRTELISEMLDEAKTELSELGHKYAIGGYILAVLAGATLGALGYKEYVGLDAKTNAKHKEQMDNIEFRNSEQFLALKEKYKSKDNLPSKIGFWDDVKGAKKSGKWTDALMPIEFRHWVIFDDKSKKWNDISREEYDALLFTKDDLKERFYKPSGSGKRKEGKYYAYYLNPDITFEDGGTLEDFYEPVRDFYIDRKTFEVNTRESIIAHEANSMEDAKSWINQQYEEFGNDPLMVDGGASHIMMAEQLEKIEALKKSITYCKEALAFEGIEEWERKEYQSVLNDHEEELKKLEKTVEYKQGGGLNIWSEIKNDFVDEDGTVFIDAYVSEDDNEEGVVIAKVKKTGEVEYINDLAKTDSYAQEVINNTVKNINEYKDGGEVESEIITWRQENNADGKKYFYAFVDGNFLVTEEDNMEMSHEVLRYNDIDLVFVIRKDHFIDEKSRQKFVDVVKAIFPELTIEQINKSTYEDGGNIGDKYQYEKGKNYPVKNIDKEDCDKYNLSAYPNFSKSGSIIGMKDKYYGKDALLVRCGKYIYNVTSSPEIYFNNSYEEGGSVVKNLDKIKNSIGEEAYNNIGRESKEQLEYHLDACQSEQKLELGRENGGKTDRYYRLKDEEWYLLYRLERTNEFIYEEGGGLVDNSFSYMMLGRLQSDNEYYLGHGNRGEKHLWAGNVDAQIAEMKRIWNSLKVKPEWLSMEDILEYEKNMKSSYVYGGDIGNVIDVKINIPKGKEYIISEENKYDFEQTISKALTNKWFGNGAFSVKIIHILVPSEVTVEITVPRGREHLINKENEYEFTQLISKTLTKKWFGNGAFHVRFNKLEEGGDFNNGIYVESNQVDEFTEEINDLYDKYYKAGNYVFISDVDNFEKDITRIYKKYFGIPTDNSDFNKNTFTENVSRYAHEPARQFILDNVSRYVTLTQYEDGGDIDASEIIMVNDDVLVYAGKHNGDEAKVIDMGMNGINGYKVEFSDGTKAIVFRTDLKKNKKKVKTTITVDNFKKEKLVAQNRMREISTILGGDKFEDGTIRLPYVSGHPLGWYYKKDDQAVKVPVEYEAELDSLSETISKYDDYMDRSDYFHKKGGNINSDESTLDRYVYEIFGMTGVRQRTISSFISDNKLSNQEVLNIVMGLGRKLILPVDFATAMSGEKGNEYYERIVAFSKSDDVYKLEEGGDVKDLSGYGGREYLQKVYLENETNNNHLVNSRLLVGVFGTKDEEKEIKEYLHKHHMGQGSEAEYKNGIDLGNKYYKQLFPNGK